MCIHFVLVSFFIVNPQSPHVQPHILFSWFDITILAEKQQKGKIDSTLVLLRRYFHALFSYQLIFSFESNLSQLFQPFRLFYRQVAKLLSKTFLITRQFLKCLKVKSTFLFFINPGIFVATKSKNFGPRLDAGTGTVVIAAIKLST